MGEENQSIDMQKGVAWSPYKSRLREIADNRRQVKQAAEDDTFNHLSASAMELDNEAYKTSDENLNKEYKKNSQLAAVSYMVKYAAKQNGADWSNLTTVSDIMSNYFNKFPETAPQIKEFINSDRDPEEFGIEMGWIENDRDEETLNWLERIWSDLKMPVDILVEGAYDLAGRGERATGNEGYADTLAIDDFALRKYGKTIANMTEEEIARLELDLDLERAKNGSYIMGDGDANVGGEYVPGKDRQRLDVAATELGLGGALSALEVAYPRASVGFATLGETPIINLPIQLFGEGGRMIGNLVSMIPGVDGWIASLPEDVQEEVKSIGGMLVLGKMIGKGTVKDGQVRPRLKNTINKITANDIIGGIMDFVSKYGDKIKDSKLYNNLSDINNNPGQLWNLALDIAKNGGKWTAEAANDLWNSVKGFAKSSDYKKLEKEGKQGDGKMGVTGLTPVEEGAIAEQMGLEAGRTINPKYIYENKQASDAYSQLDPEQLRNVKDFKSLIQMLKNSIKGKASTQDAILDTIDKRYGMGTEYREPIEGRGEFSDIPSRTVEKWFNIMERYTTFTRDKNILNIMTKVANKNKLTAKDMKNMARALDRQFKIWKKGKTHEEIKQGEAEIEATRQELNALIRQEVDLIQDFREIGIPNILEYLDKQQSPQIATIEKLVELNNKVNQIKTAIPNKSTLNKIGTFLGKFSSKAKAANTIIEKMGGADYMDALLREKNLNRALNAFSDLYEKIKKNPDNADKVINEWLKDKNNKEVAENYGGFVEGEVIEPDFNPSRSPNEFLEELLETVEIEKPENFMLGEDAKYNGNPVDYTTPTRVTPEGYPGRYGATSESYKGKPAGDFGTPAEFEPQIKPETITAEDYAGKYGQTLESFKAQLQKAGLKTDLIDAFIGNLEKKNFKVGGKQGTLFDIPSETKTTTKDKTPLKKAKKSGKSSKESDK